MKAAVHRRARALDANANANAVAPGRIAADDTEASRADPRRDRALPGRIMAGRRRPADGLAGATLFLTCPASDHVDGVALPVDGGGLGRL
ncbi:SDR family oxidoreductase [Streptomyces scabiei]|uniref:SDR family oxidoreductase n=1 Tax=Streptomyces scabiei TaxID=1930 RepID=UPI0036DFFAA0